METAGRRGAPVRRGVLRPGRPDRAGAGRDPSSRRRARRAHHRALRIGHGQGGCCCCGCSWTCARSPRSVKVLALAPLLFAPGFTIVLMLDTVHRVGGAMTRVARAAIAVAIVLVAIALVSPASPAWALCPNCLAQRQTLTPTLELLGLFLLVPFAVAAIAIWAVRRASLPPASSLASRPRWCRIACAVGASVERGRPTRAADRAAAREAGRRPVVPRSATSERDVVGHRPQVGFGQHVLPGRHGGAADARGDRCGRCRPASSPRAQRR